jgi:hypothetical protein
MTFTSLAAAVAAAAALIATPVAPATAAPAATVSEQSATVLSCLHRHQVKPADHVVTCTTANVSWKNVTWSHWGSTSATGKGELVKNRCVPTCDKGHFTTHAATITLSQVTTTAKYGRLFATATFTYSVNNAHRSKTVGLLGATRALAPLVPLEVPGQGEFFTKAGPECEIDDNAQIGHLVYCQDSRTAESVKMSTRGKIKKCTTKYCLGDAGENTPTLGYGKATGSGPFRCLVSKSGLVCTVTNGRGFVISQSTILAIRGY